MIYVFDTCSLSAVLNHYYRSRFPSFWEKFDEALLDGTVVSVRECKGELEGKFSAQVIRQLSDQNAGVFATPTIEELEFVGNIYSVAHFRQNLERKKLLQGGFFADPFVIAKAKVFDGVVVTEEKLKEGAAKVPNICRHFSVECVDLEGFMATENWTF